MVQLEEAIDILTKAVNPIKEKETIPLAEASGRVLAQDITAPMDQPPFSRSPLDGYAVRGEDTLSATKEVPVTLKVVGKIYAGEVFDGQVQEGQCVRLMTGAPIPDGANAVIRQEDTDYQDANAVICQEDTDYQGKYVKIFRGCAPYQNYCYAGEDYKKGDVLLREGEIMNGVRIGLAAGTGRDRVEVRRQIRVTVISTGDEVVEPGKKIGPGKIYDANRYLIVGRLRDLGLSGDRIISRHCKDDVAAMCESIREAAACSDLIITTGGVSVGEKDIMHQVLEDLHGQRLFWKVALKPGSPTLAFLMDKEEGNEDSLHKPDVEGNINSGNILVLCLTGNPYGVAANFELLVRPVMEKLTGNPGWNTVKLQGILENDSPKRGGRRRFMRGYMTEGIERTERAERIRPVTGEQNGHEEMKQINDGRSVRILDGSHASGTLSSMSSCNCLVEIGEGTGGKAGETVNVYLL